MISVETQRGTTVTLTEKGNFALGVIDTGTDNIVGAEEFFTDSYRIPHTYYMNLMFALVNKDTGEQTNFTMTPLTETVVIEIHTHALGDQIAWIPIIDLFQKKHGCKVLVRCHFPDLFKPFYPNLDFKKQYFEHDKGLKTISNEKIVSQATYCMKYDVTGKDVSMSPVDCRVVPLQHLGCYQLGIEPQEIRPTFKSNIKKPIISRKYIVICTCGTAQFKLWNNRDGFPDLVKYFKSKGYKVVDVGDVTDNIEGTISKNGILPFDELMNIIENAKLFVSGSNGLMWLAWAVGQTILTINNITARGTEFKHYKVDNKDVCNSCWNDTNFVFENDNEEYCPRKQNFICSSSITSEMVIKKIEDNNLI